MANVDPIEDLAGPLVDGLAKTGQVDALLEFGVTWTGGAFIALCSGKDTDAHWILLAMGTILIVPGAFLLLKRILIKRRATTPPPPRMA